MRLGLGRGLSCLAVLLLSCLAVIKIIHVHVVLVALGLAYEDRR